MINWSVWEQKWWRRGLSQGTIASLLEAGHSSSLEGADMTEVTMDRVAAMALIKERIKGKPSLATDTLSMSKAVDKLLIIFDREGV